MNATSTYDALRHFADSWGLAAMMLVFLVLVAWPFRPGGRTSNDAAANMIFRDDENG